MERLRTHIQIRVVDRIAHVEVEEWFRNDGRGIAEGVYLYPLPGEAAVQGNSLFQGDEEFTGETMDAERAREIYEQIVRTREDPALIELVWHGLIRARVFPFDPGETRRITLRYTQVLGRAGEPLELRYVVGGPGIVGAASPRPRPLPHPLPRPGPAPSGPAAVDGAPLTFTVVVEHDERFLDPFSPTHPVRVTREDGRIVVRPEGELTGRLAEGLRAHGGTDIHGALQEAFRAETPNGRLPVVVFLTDGMPTVEARLREETGRAKRALEPLGERDREALLIWDAGHSYDDIM